MWALLWLLFSRSPWAQRITVKAVITVRALAGLSSLDRRGYRQKLLWLARQVRALVRSLFALMAWDHPATVVADTAGECADLASVQFVGVGSASHCGGGHYTRGLTSSLCSLRWRGISQPLCWRSRQSKRCSGLCSLGRRGLNQLVWWRAQQLLALLSPIFARTAWTQPATVVAETSGEGAALVSVRSIFVGSACHCGGGQDC